MMNRFFLSLAALGSVCAFAGCSDSTQDVMPEVTIEKGEVTSDQITFTVTPANATACRYMVIAEGEAVPGADKVLADGKVTDADKPSTVTETGLTSGTAYTVIAAVSSENGNTAMAQEQFTTAEDPATVLDRCSFRLYGSRNVSLTLRGDVEGISYEITLDLYDDSYSEAGRLSAGTYSVSSGTEDKALNSEYSYLQKDNDQYKFESGTLEVSFEGDVYTLMLDVVLTNGGGNFKGKFNGTFEEV